MSGPDLNPTPSLPPIFFSLFFFPVTVSGLEPEASSLRHPVTRDGDARITSSSLTSGSLTNGSPSRCRRSSLDHCSYYSVQRPGALPLVPALASLLYAQPNFPLHRGSWVLFSLLLFPFLLPFIFLSFFSYFSFSAEGALSLSGSCTPE